MSNISFSAGYGEYISGEFLNSAAFELKSNDLQIFSREFISNSDFFVDLIGNNFIFTDHNFVTGEELIYNYQLSPSNTPIGIAQTIISGITTNILPKKIYAVKTGLRTIQVASSKENSLLSDPIVLNLTAYGRGIHKITSKNPNKNTLITINNIIQDPIVSTSITTYIKESITDTDLSLLVDDPNIFKGGTLMKIDDEIFRVLSVGLGTANNLFVQRGFLGTEQTNHNINSTITTINGSYNIIDDFIYFTESPYGNIFESESGLKNGSTFSGRVFFRSGVKNSSIGPYDKNYIVDNISNSFDGVTSIFTLTENNLDTAGISTDNAIVTVNDIFQAPSRLVGNPIVGAYVLNEDAGNSTIEFTGTTPPYPSYDINTSQLPRGGILFSVGLNTGFGYQPLISAGGTAVVSSAGTIRSISIGYSGSGYRQGIQTVNVGVALSDVIDTAVEIIGTASISNGIIIGTNITNPGSGYTSTNPPRVIFDSPLPYSKIPLVYSSISSGFGTGATVDIIVGQGSSIIEFNLNNLGYAYKKGEILTIPMGGTIGIPTDKSKPFEEFKITVDQLYSDTSSIRTIGGLIIFDPLDNQFNGKRKTFPLAINGEQTAILAKIGSTLKVENSILIFIDSVLQIPGESYSFNGGSILTFNEAPKAGSKSTILFYSGTTSTDIKQVEVIQTIKPGDTVQIFDNSDRLDDQNQRTVNEIIAVDTIKTNLYGKQGISESGEIRPIKWCLQDVDKFITSTGSTETSVVTKDRVIYEPLVYPTTYLIKNIDSSDTEIFVDNVKTFFDNINESPINNDISIISQDVKVSAALTAIVSTGGSIGSIDILNPGIGYLTPPKIIISSPTGIGSTALIDCTINSIGQINSIIIISSGIGYTNSSPPGIIVEPPKQKIKIIEDVTYEGDFGVISGVGTTTISGSNIVIFDFYIPTDSFLRKSNINNDPLTLTGISGISTGYYFQITNSNVGNSIISLAQTNSVIGIGTSFIDNVYEVFDFSIKQKTVSGIGLTYVAEVLTKVQNNNSLVGITSSIYYGDYSWGKIYLPQQINEKFNAYSIGITTSTIVQRNYLKYLNYLA